MRATYPGAKGLRVVVLTLAMGCGGSDTPTRMPRTVEVMSNGGTLVRYDERPVVPEWTLRETLRIGSVNGPVEENFGQVPALELLADGSIVVLDGQASEIVRFSPSGDFLELLATPGEGPGHIAGANGLQLQRDGTLWIHDPGNARIHGLRPDGSSVTVRRVVGATGFAWLGAVTAEGWVWDMDIRPGGNRERPSSGLDRREANILVKGVAIDGGITPNTDSVHVATWESRMIQVERGAFGVPMAARPLLLVDPAGFVWTGFGDEYRLTKQTLSGDTVLVVEIAPVLVEVSEEERREALASRERLMERLGRTTLDLESMLPAHQHPMALWSIDDESNLWVARYAEDRTTVWDVISPEGQLLAVARPDFEALPYYVPKIRNGAFLTVVTDELDIQYVIKAAIEH